MVPELFPIPKRKVRHRINNNSAQTSNINIEGNVLPTQVSEGTKMLPTNLGNEICSLDNAIESLTSPCKNCVDNSFAIIDSNQQADEQQLLELSSVDEGSSTNPRQHTNNAQTDDDSNARHNNSFEVSHER